MNKAPSFYEIGYKFYMNLRDFGASTNSASKYLGIDRYQKDYYCLVTVPAYIARSEKRTLNKDIVFKKCHNYTFSVIL